MKVEFDRDNHWQFNLARKFLDPLYRSRGYEVERFPGDHPMQRRHVDVRIYHPDSREHLIDEKIVRGLRKGGPAEKINLETWSCSVTGFERHGWIAREEPNDSTILLVAHAQDTSATDAEAWQTVTWLDCIWIPFQPLRTWFWNCGGPANWEEADNNQSNHSRFCKVPIDEVLHAISGSRRFVIGDQARCDTKKET